MATVNDKVTVRGRGRLVAETTVHPSLRVDDGFVVVRLDDERNDEFWAEVLLTRAQLAAMLEKMQRGHQVLVQVANGTVTEQEAQAAMEREE